MNIDKLNNYHRGWIIGNFDPSLIKTEQFEVAIVKHTKGEKIPSHFHKIATEYNVLISGKMILNNIEINADDIFIINTNEIVNPIFLEDCIILCVKIPSVPGDKYEVL